MWTHPRLQQSQKVYHFKYLDNCTYYFKWNNKYACPNCLKKEDNYTSV